MSGEEEELARKIMEQIRQTGTARLGSADILGTWATDNETALMRAVNEFAHENRWQVFVSDNNSVFTFMPERR